MKDTLIYGTIGTLASLVGFLIKKKFDKSNDFKF